MNSKAISDGEKIINVLKRLTSDLEALQSLPPFQSQIPSELFQSFPVESQMLLTQMYEAEHSFRHVFQDSNVKPNEFVAHHDTVKMLVRDVLDSIHRYDHLEMLRHYSDAGNTRRDPESIFAENEARPWGSVSKLGMFRLVMKELLSLWQGKLNTTVEEDQNQEDVKDEVAAREKKASADLKALQRELAAEQNMRERETSTREEALGKVKGELEGLKSVSRARTHEFESLIAEKDSIATNQYTMVTDKLKQHIEQMEESLREKESGNSSQERKFLTDKKGLEDAVNRIVVQYEEKMEYLRAEIARLEQELEDGKQQLQFYDESNKAMKEERTLKQELEEKRILQERTRKNKELRLLMGSAIAIQKAWKSYKKRKEEKSAKRKRKQKK